MHNVSDAYKAVMNAPMQPQTHTRLTFDVHDATASRDASPFVTDKLFWIDITDVDIGVPSEEYATFEPNRWRVDGSMYLLPDNVNEQKAQGWLTASLSGNDGVFAVPPGLTVSFLGYHSIAGLSFVFDAFQGDYATNISVTAYADNTVIKEYIITPNSARYTDFTTIDEFNKLILTFGAMNKADRRLRLAKLNFGITKLLETKDIVKTVQNFEINPISTTLPKSEITFTIDNIAKEYNADKPNGIWTYFEERQPISVEYGAEVNGQIEWVNAGKLFTTGAPTTSGIQAEFKAVDILSFMTDTYKKGRYRPNGISLYDLALDVLRDADLSKNTNSTKWWLDPELKNIYTTAPLPELTHRECLQLIANAGRCILYTDGNGVINIRLQIDPRITITDNGCMPYASVQDAFSDDTDIKYDYIAFSPNMWPVREDERNIIIPTKAPYKRVGFVSTAISESDGTFTTKPKITIKYSYPYTSYLMSLAFDHINGVIANDFTIKYYNGNLLVDTIYVSDNEKADYEAERYVAGFDKIEIEIERINKQYARCKIEKIGRGYTNDYFLDFSQAGEEPPVSKQAVLKAVEISAHTYTLDAETTELTKSTVIINGTQTVNVKYVQAQSTTATVSGGTLVSAIYNCNSCDLTIAANGEVEITITGKKIIDNKSVLLLEKNRDGDICTFDNPLITNTTVARNVGEWIGEYLKFRNVYEYDFRQDYRLECNDVIYMRSAFEDKVIARTIGLTYNTPGHMGRIKLRRLQ